MRRPIAALALCCVLAGCATGHRAARPAAISHVVFIKLLDPSESGALIRDSDEGLSTIPGVVSYAAGRHLDTGRTNVDADYDVGLYIGFDSQEDYAAYVSHSRHVELVNTWRPRWKWIRVHDVYDPTR